jgi:L-fucose isomerase-like protein
MKSEAKMGKTNGYPVNYPPQAAPKLGMVFNSNGVFSEPGKEYGERVMGQLLETLRSEGAAHKDSFIHSGRIFGYHQAQAVADEFARAQLDVVLIFNSSFPNGFVFPVISMHPALRAVPVIVAAGVEPNRAIGSAEWTTNSVCGNDMNNYAAKYIGRQARFLDGDPESQEFQDELRLLLNVYRVVKELRREYHGRFGDAPAGFHSATGDQLLFFKTFGVILETVDLLRVKEVYDRMSTRGTAGQSAFSEADIQATVREMRSGRLDLIRDPQVLYSGARLYLSLRAIIRAEGFTSASLKCWPEIPGPSIPAHPCLPLGWAMAKGDVTAFGCESDWPMAIMQSVATRLSGRPAAFLDFVNWTSGSPIVQLGHCGVGIAGLMAPNPPETLEAAGKGGVSPETRQRILDGKLAVNDALIEHGVRRQAGAESGPTHIGQFEYGVKTGLCITKTPDGRLKLLAFTGESSPQTAKGVLYSGADVRVQNYRRLDQLKREHGFPHHLAVAFCDLSRELREFAAYYGIEYLSPDQAP